MNRAIRVSILVIAIGSIVGCNGLWLDTYWRSERYVLMAVDAIGQMNLAFDTEDGMAYGLVGPTVFSVGSNDKYIVVKQHPSKNDFGEFDRSITKYYVVERTTSPELKERKQRVRGPFSREEFKTIVDSLSLPDFSKTIDELE